MSQTEPSPDTETADNQAPPKIDADSAETDRPEQPDLPDPADDPVVVEVSESIAQAKEAYQRVDRGD